MYLPKSKYKGNKHTSGDEFITSQRSVYRGWYFERYDGKYFTGRVPGQGNKEIFRIEDVVENYNTPQLQFTAEQVVPSASQIDLGYFTRYFLQDKRNKKIIEVSKLKYETYKNKNYVLNLSIPWILQGPIYDVKHNGYMYSGSSSKNKDSVFEADKTMVGLKTYITDYSQYIKDSKESPIVEKKEKEVEVLVHSENSALTYRDFLGGYTYWKIKNYTLNQSTNLAVEDNGVQALVLDATDRKLTILGNQHYKAYQYILSEPGIVEPKTLVQEFQVITQEISPRGLYINPTETQLFVVGINSKNINEYTIGNGLSNSTFSSLLDVSIEDENPVDVSFRPDGLVMYMLGQSTNSLYQYTLATAFKPATATSVSSRKLGTYISSADGFCFNPSGRQVLICDSVNSAVVEYSMDLWDIESIGYKGTVDLSSLDASPRDIAVNSNGDKMYVLGGTSGRVYELDLS